MTESNATVADSIRKLRQHCRNLVLATINAANEPLASQTPFVLDADNNFLILVSALAEHGRTLKNAVCVSVMLLPDEAGLANPFARERLIYRCNVQPVLRGSTQWQGGEKLLRQRFGKFVDTLLALPDFAMYRLQPVDGRYVAGFGAAYNIKGDQILPIGPPGK